MSVAVAQDRRALGLVAAGHACADLCQGSVPALVPFLATGPDGIGFGRTGALLLVMSVTSSVVQPLIGAWADRRAAGWTLSVGVALAGLGIAALGVANGFALMLAATALAGLGVALFHPEGARRATEAAGARPAGGLGLFAVGGSGGFALAPAIITPAVLAVGLAGAAVVLVPTLTVAALLALDGARTTTAASAGPAPDAAQPERNRPGAFAVVVGVAAARAGGYFGAQTFLAAALVSRLGVGEAAGNAALTVMLAAGIAGTVLGGVLADRAGYRRTMAGSFALTVGAVALVQVAPGLATGLPAAALLGLTVTAAYSPTIVYGQELMPASRRMAAGMTVGLAIGVGGIAATGLGVLADATSPVTALWAVAVFPALGMLLCRLLPAR